MKKMIFTFLMCIFCCILWGQESQLLGKWVSPKDTVEFLPEGKCVWNKTPLQWDTTAIANTIVVFEKKTPKSVKYLIVDGVLSLKTVEKTINLIKQ